MDYAVILTGGKQYKVKNGDILEVEHLKDAQETVKFDQVLLIVSNGDITIGKPTVADAFVEAKIVGDVRGPKIRVSKFLAKSKYRRTTGHRQSLTKVQIQSITVDGKKAASEGQVAKRTTSARKKA